MSENITYDGPANLVTSVGDSFATCHLIASVAGDGWSGTITGIAFRTQMVPFPLNPEEWFRIDGVDGAPVLKVNVADEANETATVSGSGNPFA